MTERHVSVQPQQALRLHGCSRCLRDSKLVRGAPQKRRVTDRLGGGQEEKPTRVAWEPREPPAEALLDPRGQRQHRRQVESARQLPGGQPAWELQECERVAPGFGNDALENGFVQTSREDGLQERPCIPTAQRIDTELRKRSRRLPTSRVANVSAILSASSRRATNASAAPDASSSHCASSIMHKSGCCSAASERRPRTASPTRNGLGACPAP